MDGASVHAMLSTRHACMLQHDHHAHHCRLNHCDTHRQTSLPPPPRPAQPRLETYLPIKEDNLHSAGNLTCVRVCVHTGHAVLQALEVMLGLKVQKGPGGDEDMPQAPADASTADSKQQQQASAAAAASSSGGGASHQRQQDQQTNGTAKVCTRCCRTAFTQQST